MGKDGDLVVKLTVPNETQQEFNNGILLQSPVFVGVSNQLNLHAVGPFVYIITLHPLHPLIL